MKLLKAKRKDALKDLSDDEKQMGEQVPEFISELTDLVSRFRRGRV